MSHGSPERVDYGFKELGEGAQIFPPVVILGGSRITVKNRFMMSSFAYLAGGQSTYIGNFVHLATHTSVSGGGQCVIEDFVGICAGARLITGTDDVSGIGLPTPTIPAELQSKYRSVQRSFVHCRRHSFIGTNAVIVPGVTVGEGTVVGSGAVLTRDAEPWGVYLGIPARRVADRPRARLLALESQLIAECPVDHSGLSDAIANLRDP